MVTDNEHLGLVVSGLEEEQKNVDRNIAQCRKLLFGLLGPALSYKCKLSPLAQHHLQCFFFRFSRGGGMVPPLRGGGIQSGRGGMPRETLRQ